MGKTKMEMKHIQNPSRRQVTFSKRKNGLLKKAFELSVLCDAEVALIIFSETGKISEFASHNDMETILEKYRIYTETDGNMGASSSVQSVKVGESQLKELQERMDSLKKKERNMVGEDLQSLTVKELHRLENQLRIAIKRISDKKMKIFAQNGKSLAQKVRAMEEEKIELQSKLRTRDNSISSTNLNLGYADHRHFPWSIFVLWTLSCFTSNLGVTLTDFLIIPCLAGSATLTSMAIASPVRYINRIQ